jgi:elongation factor 1-gamma
LYVVKFPCSKDKANHPGESYEFKRLDLSNAEDKAFFEGAMAWELTVDGKQWADGKNFK